MEKIVEKLAVWLMFGSNRKAKSSPSRSGSMALPIGSKQPISSPPESSRM